MILDRIVATKKEEVQQLYNQYTPSALRNESKGLPDTRDFHAALIEGKNRLKAGVALIAEVKKASPSKGVIREDFHPQEIAKAYSAAGASALSVLTDISYFQGSPAYLKLIKSTVSIPLLRKDFIVDEIQIPHSRILGADAILLIVRILEQTQLQEYITAAHEIGLHALVEVHNEQEAERALMAGARIVGVNNRNLQDFSVDLETTGRVANGIPAEITLVAESGIGSRADVDAVRELGASAILVGESLMRQANLQDAVHKLVGGLK